MTGPLRLCFRHVWNSEVIDTDVFIGPRSKWLADPRSAGPSWYVAAVNASGDIIKLSLGEGAKCSSAITTYRFNRSTHQFVGGVSGNIGGITDCGCR